MSVCAQTIFGKETIICQKATIHHGDSLKGVHLFGLVPAYGNSDVWKPNQHNCHKKNVGLEDVEIAQIYFDR